MKKHPAGVLAAVLAVAFVTTLSVLSSCSKAKSVEHGSGDTTVLSQADEDSLKYLMYHIMQVSFVNGGRDTTTSLPTYYWYSQVPVLDPFSTQYDSAENLLAQMKTYAINPATGSPYDKYSFLDRAGTVAGEIQGGQAGDYGLQVTYAFDQNNNSYLFVLYADKNSPAGKAGITRGWQITAVNGDTNIGYDGTDVGGSGANVNKVSNAIYNSSNVSLTLLKPDSTSTTASLSAAQYNINPILYDTVYTASNGKKVGYFVFYTFSSVVDAGNNPTNTQQLLAAEFNKLQSEGVNDLIVDLRYNGGGSVATAEYLDNAIAPASTGGQVMYNYIYNDKLTANLSTLTDLETQVKFSGSGQLSLENVFFVVSGNTASASELTMNNLKPYMSVHLVGQTTYGKPVGFFGFSIYDYNANRQQQHLADLYAINFETRNANNQGGYFTGITPDSQADDFVDLPWGDGQDENLKQIFNFITTGSFGRMSAQGRMQADPTLRKSIPQSIRLQRFNGMVDYKQSQRINNRVHR